MQLVIPARNEATRLPRTLEALRAHLTSTPALVGLEVIVVDNASTDDTAALAAAAHSSAMPVRVVRCDTPGKGAAVREGIRHTTAEVVGYMDADGATHFDALQSGLALISGGVDVAVGSRAVTGSVTSERHSPLRVQGAALYRRCTQQIAPGIADTQCGFKLFRGDLARGIFANVRTTGFSFDVEVLARAQQRGAAMVEFPVTWDDIPGSTFQPMRHGATAFVELVKISRRLRQPPVVVPLPIPSAPALAPVAEA